MKHFATAAALIAASATMASAERASTYVAAPFGEQIEVPAARVKSGKELHQLGLSRDETVVVTKVPAGPRDEARSGRG